MNNTAKANYLLSERNRYLLEVVAMFKREPYSPGWNVDPGELDKKAAEFEKQHSKEIDPLLAKAKRYEKAFVAEATPEELAQAEILFN
ncbi:hypothetical protein [uncultured Lactobacillus sp.]|uniref:hypothetical protein n=1 Tax=uncultured Lactobacillus sp. TaxID=153152 RepID=UPI002665348E|nr:hypothetical protein [uncultured Lactobacillus sp.]